MVRGDESCTFVKVHIRPQSGDWKRRWLLDRQWRQAGRQAPELGARLILGLEVGGQAQPTGRTHGGEGGRKADIVPLASL